MRVIVKQSYVPDYDYWPAEEELAEDPPPTTEQETPTLEEIAQDKLVEETAPTAPKPKKARLGSPGQEIPLTDIISADSPLFRETKQKMERVIVKARKRFDFDPKTGEIRPGYFAPTGLGTGTHAEHGRRLETVDTTREGWEEKDPKSRTRRINIVGQRKRGEMAGDPEVPAELQTEREKRQAHREAGGMAPVRHTELTGRAPSKEQWGLRDALTGEQQEVGGARSVIEGEFGWKSGVNNDPMVMPVSQNLTDIGVKMWSPRMKSGPSQRLDLSKLLWNYATRHNTKITDGPNKGDSKYEGAYHLGDLLEMPHIPELIAGYQWHRAQEIKDPDYQKLGNARKWKQAALQDMINSIASSPSRDNIMADLGAQFTNPATKNQFIRPEELAPTMDSFANRWQAALSPDTEGAQQDALNVAMTEAARSFQLPAELQEDFKNRIEALMGARNIDFADAAQQVGTEMEQEQVEEESTVYDDPALFGEGKVITPEEQMGEGLRIAGEEPDPIFIDPVTDPSNRLANPTVLPDTRSVDAPVTDPKDVLAEGSDFAPMRDRPVRPRITQRIPDPKPVDPNVPTGTTTGKRTMQDFMREQGIGVPEDEDEDEDDNIQLSFDYPLGEQLLKSILANMVTSR